MEAIKSAEAQEKKFEKGVKSKLIVSFEVFKSSKFCSREQKHKPNIQSSCIKLIFLIGALMKELYCVVMEKNEFEFQA